MRPGRALAAALILFAAEPSAAAVTVRQLVETASLSGLCLSPNGRLAAVRIDRADLGANRTLLSWRIVSLEENRQIAEFDGGLAIWTGAGTLADEVPAWSADSKFIYIRRLTDQGVQVWRAEASTGKLAQVTDEAADVVRFRLEDGRLVFETEGATRDEILNEERLEAERGIRVDGSVDPAQALTRSVEINGRLASERLKEPWFTRTHLLGHRPPRVRLLELARDGSQSPARDVQEPFDRPAQGTADDPSDHGHRRRAAGPAAVAFIRGWGAEARPAWSLSPGGQVKECRLAMCMGVTALGWRGQTGEIAFTSRATGLSEALNLLDTASGRVRRVAQAQSLSGDAGPGCTFASDLAICIESGGSLPPRLSSIAHRNGRKRVLLNPNRELERAIAIPARTIGWTLGDGRAALGQLLLAQGRNGPAPLLINYYDCRGFLKGGTGDEWPMQLLAQSGIAVLCIQQLPGSAKAPGDNVADYSTGLQAIEAAIDHLAGKGIVDPRRVGISGLSFGSEVAMWAAMKSDRVAAVSIASPTLDAGTYYYFNARPDRDFAAMLEAAWGLKSPEEQPDKWRSLSAADQVGRIDAPVLMQMSEQEFRFNLRFLSRMLAHGRAADLYVFPNERHLLAEPRHRLSAYGRNLDWFRFWLGGEEDPDAGKAAQYEAWRKLRARHCAAIASRKSFCSDR